VDKVQTVSKKRIGKVIGSVDDTALLEVNRALAVFLGIV
jgi:mRNA-degrading endonuclease toxin of MazEF toxin-antitoxin module